MLEFGGLFAGSTAISAYFIGSAVCIGLNALLAAWLFMRGDKTRPQEPQPTNRLKIVAATAGVTLFLMTSVGAGLGLIAFDRQAVAAGAPETISVDDIQRRIDTNTLPVQEVSDYM